ncbi:MAG: aspartyl protease family protein [Elusimicrobia bacterium]|nr:aspartyl protease family protein [Elusimicrobiota bacterium]
MGEIRVKVRLENGVDILLQKKGKKGKKGGKNIRTAEVEAIVDTGAVMMLLPQDLVDNLGLDIIGKTIVALADETKKELDVAKTVVITIAGRQWETDCLVGPPGCEPLIGQLILERLDLILDPLKHTITPRPESPYLPTLKLK